MKKPTDEKSKKKIITESEHSAKIDEVIIDSVHSSDEISQ